MGADQLPHLVAGALHQVGGADQVDEEDGRRGRVGPDARL